MDSQEQKKVDILKAQFRTKLNPKKKIKDTQNKILEDIMSKSHEHTVKDPVSQCDASRGKNTPNKKSRIKLTTSVQALRTLLIANAELIKSLEYDVEEDNEEVNQEILHSPLKHGALIMKPSSNVKLPSLKLSLKIDSVISSLLDSNLPSSAQKKDVNSRMLGSYVPLRTSAQQFNESSNLINEIRAKLNAIGLVFQETSKEAVQSLLNQISQSDNLCAENREWKMTVGDLAYKHLVNPITVKLANFCAKQGELYLEILIEFQKACSEFEKACKKRGLQ